MNHVAPKVSRKFYYVLQQLGLWALFVGALKRYAHIVKASRVITLDGVDAADGNGRTERREYLFRWHLIPRNPWLNLYLHYFVHGDDYRALHDHPWDSASLILEGGYLEHTSLWVSKPKDPTDPVAVSAYTKALFELCSPTDGRSYVYNSATNNQGIYQGEDKLDFCQLFSAGDFRRLPADHMHMIELFDRNTRPCWSLFMTGKRVRRWGFACPSEPTGWRDYEKYLAEIKPGQSRGCN